MSIRKENGKFVLVCDNCEDKGEEKYDTFDEAVKGKKVEGWHSKKYANGWADLCPDYKD